MTVYSQSNIYFWLLSYDHVFPERNGRKGLSKLLMAILIFFVIPSG